MYLDASQEKSRKLRRIRARGEARKEPVLDEPHELDALAVEGYLSRRLRRQVVPAGHDAVFDRRRVSVGLLQDARPRQRRGEGAAGGAAQADDPVPVLNAVGEQGFERPRDERALAPAALAGNRNSLSSHRPRAPAGKLWDEVPALSTAGLESKVGVRDAVRVASEVRVVVRVHAAPVVHPVLLGSHEDGAEHADHDGDDGVHEARERVKSTPPPACEGVSSIVGRFPLEASRVDQNRVADTPHRPKKAAFAAIAAR